jgi:hypothetical protein
MKEVISSPSNKLINAFRKLTLPLIDIGFIPRACCSLDNNSVSIAGMVMFVDILR